jgi:hypothetical protein
MDMLIASSIIPLFICWFVGMISLEEYIKTHSQFTDFRVRAFIAGTALLSIGFVGLFIMVFKAIE